MADYKPPFTITNKMLDYVSSIMEKIGKLDNYTNFNKMPVLRRNNRIRSIHSSLAIEANSLSLGQVKDVIAGRTVIGPQKEIQEVKNAYNAYETINRVDAFSIKDLKKVHFFCKKLFPNPENWFTIIRNRHRPEAEKGAWNNAEGQAQSAFQEGRHCYHPALPGSDGIRPLRAGKRQGRAPGAERPGRDHAPAGADHHRAERRTGI